MVTTDKRLGLRDLQADMSRKNLGVPRRQDRGDQRGDQRDSFQRQQDRDRSDQRFALRYMDKPAIRLEELNEEAKNHMQNAFGIGNQEAWEKDFGLKICRLCSTPERAANHLGNRCIRLFCRSDKGQLYYGVATNAKQIRFQLANTGKMNFATVLALTEGLSSDPEAREAAEFVVDCVIDDSEVLSMYFAGTITDVTDDVAVCEFDRCHESLHATLTMPLARPLA